MTTTEATDFLPESLAARADQVFPHLSADVIARVAQHGQVRRVSAGEVLVASGQPHTLFFVVLSGAVAIVRQTPAGETLVTVHRAGQFNGEVTLLAGRRTLTTARVVEDGEILALERSALMSLIQTDAELSEIVMRAYILRRVALLAGRIGDVVVVGSLHCGDTLRVKEFLNRNGHPYQYIDLDREGDVQEFVDHFHIQPEDIPVVICRGERALRKPTNEQIADCLGFNDSIDLGQMRDVVIVGAGPAGLAAAVYAASEGLDVLVLEASAPGGQAGSSSKIENYLGFPNGIPGQELASRAYNQAQKFGAQFAVAKGAVGIDCDAGRYAIQLADGTNVRARCIIIASGAQYRKLPLEGLRQYEGLGVYYAATFMESLVCGGQEVAIVGGGNSAGQAAVFLAGSAKHVHLVVRSGGLADSMSRYLELRIADDPRITLHTYTEITGLEGVGHLERVYWRNNQTGEQECHPIRHLFLMTGADPSTNWLRDCVTVDARGFIKTGADLSPSDLADAGWALTRRPFQLETSRPGVFAVGDVRAGNLKRVASAVGEGAAAVALIHRTLTE